MTRCPYAVRYGNATARFTSRHHALMFAREASRVGGVWTADDGTTVTAYDGIIAQFSDGKATPEFAHLDR